MKVFLPIATKQDLIVRPRNTANVVTVTIRDEFKDETTTITGIATTLFIDGYLTIPFSYPFIEGKTFEIEVTDDLDGSLVWRGKAFATAQTPQDYKLNE